MTTPLGTRLAWIRDLTLVGAASTAAPAMVVLHVFPDFVKVAAVVGPLTGAVLGIVLRPLLLGPLSRVPFIALIGVGALLGALWGASVGGLAAEGAALLAANGSPSGLDIPPVELGLLCGAVAGAIQLGWFFVPYTLQRARGRPAWPVVVVACALSPALGIAALQILGRFA